MATRTPASVTITIRPNDGINLIEADGAASSAACGIKNLVKRWSIGLLDEQFEEVFLKGLVCGSRSLSEHGVRAFWHTLYLNARHGAIMAPMAPLCKHS
jgi:hypothetical protein